jgi:hypothetical protein
MATPDGIDLKAFIAEVDKRKELFGARIVYFDGGTMSVLRQGPPMCQSGLLALVIRKGGKELIPTSSEVAEARDKRFNAELLNLGFSCGGAILSYVVVAGSAGLAPVTGGSSLIVTHLSAASGIAAGAQCVMAGVRMINEYRRPQANVEMDDETWYKWFSGVTDGISLAGAVVSGAQTLRMVSILKNSTRKSALEVLKGLSRQERRKLTEELIRVNNPGISDQEIKVLMSRNILPNKLSRRYSNDQIAKAVRKQLLDAVDAAMDFASSSTNGLISQAGQTGKVGDYLFGVVNAFEAM